MNLHQPVVETLLILTASTFRPCWHMHVETISMSNACVARACACPKSEEMMDLPAIRRCFSLAHFATRN